MAEDTDEPQERSVVARLSRRQALKAGAVGMALFVATGHISPAAASELARLAHGRPMTAAQLVDILRDERAQWNTLLAQVGANRMEVPGAEGTWSVKDVVAHLTWYERAVVDGAKQIMSTGSFTRGGNDSAGMDERNARIVTESRARSVDDVLAEADEVFSQLVRVIAACPDDMLNDPNLLDLPDDIPPWMRVANNSYAHYRQHAESIRAWLASDTNAQA